MHLGLGLSGEVKVDEQEQDVYASYNSLGRKPLILGIPIIVLVFGLLAILLSAILSIVTVGIKGLVIPALFVFLLIYVRIRCEHDSRAIEDIYWDIRGGLVRIVSQSRIVSFSYIDDTERKRKQHVSEWLKNNTIDK